MAQVLFFYFFISWFVPYPSEGISKPKFSDTEKKWISEHPSINLAIDQTYPPMSFLSRQDKIIGINVDYIELLSKKTGIKIRLTGSSWDEALNRAMKHEVDGIINATELEERKTKLNFTIAYSTSPVALVCLSSMNQAYSFQNFQHKKVAAKHNSSHLKMLQSRIPTENIVEIGTLFEGFELLTTNKIDAIFDDLPPLYYLISKYNLNNVKVAFIEQHDTISSSKLGLRNDDPVLLSVFNKAILSISEEERKTINKKWLNLSPEVSYAKFYIAIGILLAVALLSGIWIVVMRSLVKTRTADLEKELAERQKAEENLRQSKKKFTNLAKTIPALVFQLKVVSVHHFVFTFISPKAKDEFGLSDDPEHEQWRNFKLIHPEDKERFVRSLHQSIAKKADWDFEGRIVNSDQELFWFRGLSSPITQNKELLFNGILINTTSQKKAEKALIKSETTFKKIIEASSGKGGKEYFNRMTKALSAINHADVTFIGRKKLNHSIKSISLYSTTNPIDTIEFEISGSVWGKVFNEQKVVYLDDIAEYISNDTFLQQHKIKALVAAPVFDPDSNCIGLIASLFSHPLKNKRGLSYTFEIVASTIGSEIVRHETQLALKKSEENFKRVVDFSPIAIGLSDETNRILKINKKFTELFGYTHEEIPTVEEWSELAYPDEKAREHLLFEWSRHIEDYFATGTFVPLEVTVTCKNQEQKDIVLGFESINGVYITSFTNLTNINRTKNELIKEKDFSERLINSLPAVFVLFVKTNNDYTLVRWNNNFENVTLYSNEELFSMSPRKFWSHQQQEDIIKLFSSDRVDTEIQLKTKLGAEIPYYLSGATFIQENRTYFYGVGIDISERIKIEDELKKHKYALEQLVEERTDALAVTNEELRATNDELHLSNKRLEFQKKKIETTLAQLQETQSQLIQSEKMASLGILTAGIAHEINNPVNFISSSAFGLDNFIGGFNQVYSEYDKLTKENFSTKIQEIQTLKEELDFDFMRENATSILENINLGASRISEIVKSLKTFTRQNETTKQAADLHQNIEATLTMLFHETKNRVKIIREFSEIPPINCVPGKINQVFMNLIMNAIQAIEGQGTIIIKTKLSSNKKFAVVEISDSGKGIPEEIKDKIFEPFFTTKSVGQGSGLGLYICYNIINEHNGTLYFESSEEKGTTFTLTLPIDS